MEKAKREMRERRCGVEKVFVKVTVATKTIFRPIPPFSWLFSSMCGTFEKVETQVAALAEGISAF